MDRLNETVDVSIVVPAWRDTRAFARLAEASREWTRRTREIVVVSGEPDSDLEAICTRQGYRYIVSQTNRGTQLDCGARAAGGATLWFLHADALPDPRALEAIAAARDAGFDSGCFRFAFQGRSTVMKRIIEKLVRLRVALSGTAYGDQGLFATREAYAAVGGFAHMPLFEEVRFVKQLRARGTFTHLSVPIFVATHRYERDGYLRRSLHNRWLAICHGLGVPANRLSERYRRGPHDGREARR